MNPQLTALLNHEQLNLVTIKFMLNHCKAQEDRPNYRKLIWKQQVIKNVKNTKN